MPRESEVSSPKNRKTPSHLDQSNPAVLDSRAELLSSWKIYLQNMPTE